jgi:hypothetical protein
MIFMTDVSARPVPAQSAPFQPFGVTGCSKTNASFLFAFIRG